MARLTDKQDAYGHALHDYCLGEGTYEIVERDDGYVDCSGGPAYYLSGFSDWPAHQRRALRFARGRVLDVGCGAGRVALYLQEQGHEVVGIDVSPLAVKVCRDRGVKDARVLSITQASRRLGIFDTIVMYGNNFGLFGSLSRARWLLRRFRGMTGDGARIIAESRDPYSTDAPWHTAYHRTNKRRGRMGGQLRIRVRYRLHCTPWFDYLLASQDEMREIVDGTGWAVGQTFAGGAGSYTAVIEKTA
jgi:SAM-dependent methyltransferase